MLYLALFALTAWLVFIAVYWTLARWWQSDIGWNVMGVAAAVTTLLALNVSSIAWPDYDYRPFVRGTVYLFVGLMAVQRTAQVIREQRHP